MDARTRAEYVERAVWPIGRGDRNFWIAVVVLSALVAAGVFAWIYQLSNGLWVTGLNQKVSWGFYIINCVFFIGISYGGAITSAILRLTNAPWRAPLSRMAETMAVVALMVGGLFPIIDLGRPDRMYNLLLHGQVGSPVVWDVVAITTYMAAGLVFLYLPLVPDIAICRDQLGPVAGGLRRALYERLGPGGQGTP